MCKYCESVNADMAEEPCKSCSFTRGNFKLNLSDHDKQIRDEVIDSFVKELLKYTIECNVGGEKPLRVITDFGIKNIAEQMKGEQNE